MEREEEIILITFQFCNAVCHSGGESVCLLLRGEVQAIRNLTITPTVKDV